MFIYKDFESINFRFLLSKKKNLKQNDIVEVVVLTSLELCTFSFSFNKLHTRNFVHFPRSYIRMMNGNKYFVFISIFYGI